MKKADGAKHEMPVAKSEERLGFAKEAPAAASRPSAKRTVGSQSIWLLGTVVMVSDATSRTEMTTDTPSMSAREKSSGVAAASSQRRKTFIVQRKDGSEEVVLQQRAYSALPRSRQTQMGKKNRVETLLETNEQGLVLTIYSDAVTAEEIEHATVESNSPDSLIVSTSTQKILYRLPAGLFRSAIQPARP